jgi:hypothetical protein
MRTYITIDVDPDFASNKKRKNAVEGVYRCLEIFEEFSIKERITWLVNDAELQLTSSGEDCLSKMSDGEIGLHLHLDRPPWSSNYYYLPEREEDIYSAVKKEKETLERWTVENLDKEVIIFRSGDLLTDARLFNVLNKLGIKVDSSLPSQFDWSLKEIFRKVLCNMPLGVRLRGSKILVNKRAYPTLALGAKPFRIGQLLEMPLHVYVGGSNTAAGINWIKKRTVEHIEGGVEDLVVYWHPHEVLKREDIYVEYIEYLLGRGFEFRTLGEDCWK